MQFLKSFLGSHFVTMSAFVGFNLQDFHAQKQILVNQINEQVVKRKRSIF